MTTVYKAREREETSIPIAEVLKDNRVDIFPELQNKLYFGIRFKADKLVVTAGKYIGLIHLNDRVAIDVEPKISINNLIEILSKTDGDILGLKRTEVGYSVSTSMPRSVLEAIAESFIRCLKKIEIEGLAKRYESKTSSGGTIKGKIEFQKSIQELWSRGLRHCVVSTHFEQSTDILENRLLRYCCFWLLKHFEKSYPRKELLSSLNYFDDLFSRAGTALIRPEGNVRKIAGSSLSETYARALRLVAALISNEGIQLPVGGADIFLPSFLVDMETLFEDYMRGVLGVRLNEFTVLNGNELGGKPLFDDRARPSANPDIVIGEDGEPLLLVEVKYKFRWSREDLNQIITYAISYNLYSALLLLPSENPSESGLSTIGTLNGIRIFKYGFRIGSVSLDQEEDSLANTIMGLLSSSASPIQTSLVTSPI